MTRLSKILLGAALAAIAVAPIGAQKAVRSDVLLEAANQKATLEGDLPGAIKLYRQVVATFAETDRTAAATALLKIAECYEKESNPEAPKIYKEIVTKYADVKSVAATAQSRLGKPVGTPQLYCDLCGDDYGAISRDGRFLATSYQQREDGDINIVDMSSGVVTPLQIDGTPLPAEGVGATSAAGAYSVVFSPDGRQIAYEWSGNHYSELRVMPREVRGKSRVVATNTESDTLEPYGWSADGRILVSAGKRDKSHELQMISVSTGAATTVKSLGFRIGDEVHWASLSYDGRFIAYEALTTNPSGPPDTNTQLERQIYVIAPDGSGETAITSGAGVKHGPVWTPDGAYVLYTSNVTGVWDLWAVPMRTGRPAGDAVLVRKKIGDVTSLGITASGVYHYFEGRAGVFHTSISTLGSSSQPTQAAPRTIEKVVGSRPAWSPDGKSIAMSRPRSVGPEGNGFDSVDLIVRTVASGQERVFKGDGIPGIGFVWFPNSDGLLVLKRENANESFWTRLDLATGEFHKLVQQRANPDFATARGIRALSPDGRTLYFGTFINGSSEQIDRISALDLSTGSYRDVFRLPVDPSALPKGPRDMALAVGPDGRSLAMLRTEGKAGLTHLAIVGVDGQGYHEITPVFRSGWLHKIVWSRDSRWIYCNATVGELTDDKDRIMRIPAAGGPAESTGIEVERLDAFDISPDGTRLVYSTQFPEGYGNMHWTLDVMAFLRSAR